VEAARRLVVGTNLTQRAIAARVGISQERVSAWTRRRGWRRPAGAPVHNGAASFAQAGPERRARDLCRRAEALGRRYADALAAAPEPDPAAISLARHLAETARWLGARRNASSCRPGGGP
jgi:hypothetical protein